MARVAIITGPDSGIGKASAVALAEAGFDVGITWHEDQKGAEDTAAQVRAKGRRAEVRRLDLNQLPEAGGVIDELADALGGLDVFVNNAGAWNQNAEHLDAGGFSPGAHGGPRRSRGAAHLHASRPQTGLPGALGRFSWQGRT